MRGYPRTSEGSASDNRNGDQIVREQFAKRLYRALINKGWTQSELARQANLTRNAVSTYMRAQALPTPNNLEALAKALGVAPEELLPPVGQVLAEPVMPIDVCSFKEVGSGQARLQVNKIVSTDTALEVVQLINRDRTQTSD